MRDLRYELVRRLFKLRPPRAARRRVAQGSPRPDVRRRGAARRSLHPRRRHRPHHSCSCAVRTAVARVFGLVARALAYEGFQVVVQSCRGTAGSGGRFDRPFRTEADDGRDTVAWLREQSFYPGRFATFCGSYLGYVQLALPPESKTDLFARGAPDHPVEHPRHRVARRRGAGVGDVARAGRRRRTATRAARLGILHGRRDRKHVRVTGTTAPLMQSYKSGRRSRIGFLEDWWTHPEPDDPFWNDQDHHDSLDTYECPVLVQSGWYDLLLESSIGQYERLAGRGADVRLTVGPWTHATFATKGLGILMTETADFLRAACGLDAPVVEPWRAPARRPNRCGTTARCVAAGERGGASTTSLPARCRRDAPDQNVAATSFTYDPSSPTPQVGGPLLEPSGVLSTTQNSSDAPTSSPSTCRR